MFAFGGTDIAVVLLVLELAATGSSNGRRGGSFAGGGFALLVICGSQILC